MRIYYYALISLIILFVAHVIGNRYDLYHYIHGYDIPMHVLGGLGIGFSVYAVLSTFVRVFRDTIHFDLKKNSWVVVLFVFIGGFLWELFEAHYNIAGAPVGTKAYYIDTIKDLVDDVIGGCIAVYSVKKNN